MRLVPPLHPSTTALDTRSWSWAPPLRPRTGATSICKQNHRVSGPHVAHLGKLHAETLRCEGSQQQLGSKAWNQVGSSTARTQLQASNAGASPFVQ
jgi:hypothetical protein